MIEKKKQETVTDPYRLIKRSLLVSMIFIPLIPFVAVILIGGYFFYASIRNMTIEAMHRVVDDHRQMIASFLTEREKDLDCILDTYQVQALSKPEEIDRVFSILQKKSVAFTDLGLFDASGVHLSYSGPYALSGKNYADEYWFKEVMKKGVYISDVFLGYRKAPHFIIAVVRAHDSAKWVLRATIDTQFFTELVESVRIGKTGETYIVNQSGFFQTERRSGGHLMMRDPDYDSDNMGYASPRRELASPGHANIRSFVKEIGDEAYLYTTAGMKNNQWILTARQEASDAFRMLHFVVYLILLITALGGMIIVPLAFFLTSRIIHRMEKTDSEKDVLEQQLIGASRLAELGEMAAGFAHEINNPLQIIKSEQALIDVLLADLIQESGLSTSENLDQLKDSLDQIHLQINRCAKITQAILKFGRQGEPQPQTILLTDFIPEVAAMVEKRANVEDINIVKAIDPYLPTVFGDPAQLQQVLLNLFNNAIDAILAKPLRDGDEIRITAIQNSEGEVEIGVTDTGIGIESADKEKIFAPFFTTKPVGKGTGLGLSVCYGIVEHMGGRLSVSSRKNVGSTFTIILPRGRG